MTDTHPGQDGLTGRCGTCDSRNCPTTGCLNPPTDTDNTPDDLTYLED
jgi:hypothetical protein